MLTETPRKTPPSNCDYQVAMIRPKMSTSTVHLRLSSAMFASRTLLRDRTRSRLLPAACWRVRDLLFALRSGGLQPGAPRQGTVSTEPPGLYPTAVIPNPLASFASGVRDLLFSHQHLRRPKRGPTTQSRLRTQKIAILARQSLNYRGIFTRPTSIRL